MIYILTTQPGRSPQKGSGFSWVSFRCKGFIFRAYESIHNQQHSTNPKNVLSSCLILGKGKYMIPSTHSGPILCLPLLIKCLKYLTSGSKNWSFPFEIHKSFSCKWLRRLVEKAATCSIASPDMRRSSTYWSWHMRLRYKFVLEPALKFGQRG